MGILSEGEPRLKTEARQRLRTFEQLFAIAGAADMKA
jgi:hypothetical protein